MDSKEPFASWLKDFDRDLTNARLEFILVDTTTLPDGVLPAGGNASGLAILAAHLARDYKPRLTLKDAILFKRSSGA